LLFIFYFGKMKEEEKNRIDPIFHSDFMEWLYKYKKIIIISLVEILGLTLLVWLGYQHFYGGGITLKFWERKTYNETSLNITDATMGASLKQGESVKELRGYYEVNKVKRGDFVIVKLEDREEFIRKVVAIPGDEITFEGFNLKVGRNIIENSEQKPYLFPDTIQESLKGKIPKNSYLVLSDQISPSSFDSRQFGFITKEQLQAKIVKE